MSPPDFETLCLKPVPSPGGSPGFRSNSIEPIDYEMTSNKRSEGATAPKTPFCIVTILSAAS